MKNEIWKDVLGYEGLYKVSNLGRIKSLYTGKVLAKRIDTSNYIHVVLYKNKIKKTYRVHRLVAEAFIPNPKKLPFVNHRDENRQNNIVDNLEWVTHSQNIAYSIGKKIKQYDKNNKFIREWETAKEAEKSLGLCNGKVTAVCKGHRYTTGGCIWKYAE